MYTKNRPFRRQFFRSVASVKYEPPISYAMFERYEATLIELKLIDGPHPPLTLAPVYGFDIRFDQPHSHSPSEFLVCSIRRMTPDCTWGYLELDGDRIILENQYQDLVVTFLDLDSHTPGFALITPNGVEPLPPAYDARIYGLGTANTSDSASYNCCLAVRGFWPPNPPAPSPPDD